MLTVSKGQGLPRGTTVTKALEGLQYQGQGLLFTAFELVTLDSRQTLLRVTVGRRHRQ